jgi:hypothetical protein
LQVESVLQLVAVESVVVVVASELPTEVHAVNATVATKAAMMNFFMFLFLIVK